MQQIVKTLVYDRFSLVVGNIIMSLRYILAIEYAVYRYTNTKVMCL